MSKKVMIVLGTRPEAIKLAPLIRLLKKEQVDTYVCTTGQHREMLEQVMKVFAITADQDLALMSHNQTLPGFVAKSLDALSEHIRQTNPDYIVVQGDTSTVLSASLAAFYHKKKLLHVEAGLRTADLYSPFPEEMNRRLTSELAFFHFAPTETARQNLLKESISEASIAVTGNTSIDALLQTKERINNGELKPAIAAELIEAINAYSKMVLITGHRRENFGDGFLNICNAIKQSASEHQDCLFIYPVHLNPNVQNVVYEMLNGVPNIRLIPPQSYVEFVYLMMQSTVILTDSGGVQEEAPSLQKPILVMRENTERPEGVEAGCSLLVGTDVETITGEIRKLLTDKQYYQSFTGRENPYGDGRACERIVSIIKSMS